jgi:hypothetical protein
MHFPSNVLPAEPLITRTPRRPRKLPAEAPADRIQVQRLPALGAMEEGRQR